VIRNAQLILMVVELVAPAQAGAQPSPLLMGAESERQGLGPGLRRDDG
jgi:hypothetical protein